MLVTLAYNVVANKDQIEKIRDVGKDEFIRFTMSGLVCEATLSKVSTDDDKIYCGYVQTDDKLPDEQVKEIDEKLTMSKISFRRLTPITIGDGETLGIFTREPYEYSITKDVSRVEYSNRLDYFIDALAELAYFIKLVVYGVDLHTEDNK